MKTFQWFARKGIFYVPVSIAGWIIFAIAAVFAFYLFADIDSRSHSAIDTIINSVFNFILIGLFYAIIAFFTEKRK